MTVSVVISAFNASDTIGIALEALTKQDYSDFEVIVVDDASTDDTSEVAGTFCDRLNLKVLRPEENLGRARVRNFGVAKSKGEVILLLDGDIETVPNYVASHVELHERVPNAVGIGALRYPPYLANRALAHYYASRGGARVKSYKPFPGKAFQSALASFPRSLFDAVGGFHEGFRVYGGEDLELGLRLEEFGAQLTYLPKALGFHHHLRGVREVVKTLENYGQLGIPQLLKLHPDFARSMRLKDLSDGKFDPLSLIYGLASSPVLFCPALALVEAFEKHRLPSPLISYIIYRSYRKGYRKYLSSVVKS